MSELPTGVPQEPYTLLGTALIGAWVNVGLFTFELIQLWCYFTVHPLFSFRGAARANGSATGRRQDRAWIQFMVLWMLIMDTLASGTACALVYELGVTGWGRNSALRPDALTMTIYNVSNACCVLTMHLFLISRYYTLSRYKIFSTFLVLLAFIPFVLVHIISISILTRNRHLAAWAIVRHLATASLIANVVTDWLIAGALTRLLLAIQPTISDSERLIPRLIRACLLSGSAPAAAALLCLIVHLVSPLIELSLMLSLCLGRAPSITVLYNLNRRSTFANNTHSTTEAMYVDTTVESGQIFSGDRDRWRTGVKATGSESVVGSLDDAGLDSKTTTDIDPTAKNRRPRASCVRISLASGSPSRLITTSDVTLGM